MSEKTRIVRVGVLQTSMGHAPSENTDRACEHLLTAGKAGFDLVVLPELFANRYFPQTQDPAHFDLAEPIDGPTVTRMQKISRETKMVLVVPWFERAGAGLFYNSAVTLEKDGTIVGRYRKVHIPQDPGFEEKYHFRPGTTGFPVSKTSIGRVGVLICWDQWFPEAARALALGGAEFVCVPTAIGTLTEDSDKDRQLSAWTAVQKGHAVSNGVFWAAANRIGFEGCSAKVGIGFWGHSTIWDPWGDPLVCAERSETGLVGAGCDLRELEKARRTWPFLRDRRPETYGGLAREDP